RWTEQKKRRLLDSRVKGTRLLSEALSRTQRPPRVMVCASAIGYYGNRGAELLREDSPPGSLVLSRLCREWEEAAEPARRKGIRVVHPRFGVVLSALGGALAKMLFPFRMGPRRDSVVRAWSTTPSTSSIAIQLMYCSPLPI